VTASVERTIARNGLTELEVRKSRFIGSAFRVSNESEARQIIDAVRNEHWNANHNCTAWRIGREGRLQRTSDDGEPAGTAGVPMLEVLNHQNVTDVLVVVTRYFGGVKLGAGGLIRAYGSAVSAVLSHVGIVERRPLHIVSVAVGHADSGKFENVLRASPFPLMDVAYNPDHVAFTVHLPPEELVPYKALVSEATSGSAHPVDTGTTLVEVPVQEDWGSDQIRPDPLQS
jgi:uncharacterized YigZ family protein